MTDYLYLTDYSFDPTTSPYSFAVEKQTLIDDITCLDANLADMSKYQPFIYAIFLDLGKYGLNGTSVHDYLAFHITHPEAITPDNYWHIRLAIRDLTHLYTVFADHFQA